MENYNDKAYESGWVDYQKRSNWFESMANYLKSERAKALISYDDIRSALSVGTGDGVIDCFFLSFCSNIQKYTCIEPDGRRFELCKKNLSTRHPTLNVQCIQDVFENYPVPEEPLDALVLFQSLYAFIGNLGPSLRRIMSFVKDGGQVVIIINHGTIYSAMGLSPEKEKEIIGFADSVRETLKELKLQYVEDKIEDLVFDLTDEGINYFGFLDVLLYKNVSLEKKKDIVAKLTDLCIPGTKNVPFEQFAFIITK